MKAIDKKEEISKQLAFYGKLLTDKQFEVMTLYYDEDYSLQEIADLKGISKNAIYDLINRTENTLENYESKLNLVQKFKLRDRIYKELLESKDKVVLTLVKQCIDIEEENI